MENVFQEIRTHKIKIKMINLKIKNNMTLIKGIGKVRINILETNI